MGNLTIGERVREGAGGWTARRQAPAWWLALAGIVQFGCAPDIVPDQAEADSSSGAQIEVPPGSVAQADSDGNFVIPGTDDAPEVLYAMLTAPAGAEFVVEFVDAVDPRRHGPGDRFRASVFRPLIENHMILVPMHSLVHGEVAAVRKPAGIGTDSGPTLVTLRFIDVLIGGRTWPMSASVVEVERGPGYVAAAGGAAESVAGAAAGAGGGTAIALPAGSSSAEFHAGALLRLRLDQPLVFGLPNFSGP